MTPMQAARRAISLYKNPMIEKSLQRHNQRQWLRAIGVLGPSWILATPITRAPKPPRRQLHA